ncbi:SlyX protein, partial [Avibacterium avium]
DIKGKSETSYLSIIQALKETCLSNKQFKNQDELISYLAEHYDGYVGLSATNLRQKFALANKIQ